MQELGIKQVVYNMAVDDICSAASEPGAIPFTYNGATYYFNGDMIGKYDSMFKSFNNYGVQVTIVLLNQGKTRMHRIWFIRRQLVRNVRDMH